MSSIREVLITSEASGQLWNACIWEPHSGTTLRTFKGGTAAPRTLSLLRNDYLLAAVNYKPLIHVWALHRKEQQQQRLVCGGRVTALAGSADGQYCVAALEENIHLWQVSSGHLLAVLTRHYQPIHCLRFTDDGSHFISAGDDNFVAVWAMSSVLSISRGQSLPSGIEPRWVWGSHSLPVTDVHVGCAGPRARVATVSMDQTCRVWDMGSGCLLCSVVFDCSLTSVSMDNMETRLFAGAATGHIYQVNLFETPVRTERHVSESPAGSLVLAGHSKQVTCLAVSLDGTVLASGSHDATVKLWDIHSRQCIRTIQHKGAVLNLLLVPTPQGLLSTENCPTLPIQQFQRHLFSETEGKRDTITVRFRKRKVPEDSTSGDILHSKCLQTLEKKGDDISLQEVTEELQKQVVDLSKINGDIFDFAVNEILKNTNKDS